MEKLSDILRQVMTEKKSAAVRYENGAMDYVEDFFRQSTRTLFFPAQRKGNLIEIPNPFNPDEKKILKVI